MKKYIDFNAANSFEKDFFKWMMVNNKKDF